MIYIQHSTNSMLSKTPLVFCFYHGYYRCYPNNTNKSYSKDIKSSDPVCQLCNKNINGKHLLRIYSVSGKDKGLELKILHTCGIHTQENDYLPKVICRVCSGFNEKMWNFQNLCQKNQAELRQNISIKMVSKFSPSSAKPPGKRQLKNIFNLMWFHYKI